MLKTNFVSYFGKNPPNFGCHKIGKKKPSCGWLFKLAVAARERLWE